MIKVGVTGALGKMGKEVVKAVSKATDTELALAVDITCSGMDIGQIVFGKENGVKLESDLLTGLKLFKPDVVIDFTQPSIIFDNAKLYLENGIASVIGTTGLSDEQIDSLKKLSIETKTACFIAPNFSTGAVLMMMFAKQAAKYFDNAEIIEFHHNQKKDAPSGTAIKTAKLMAETKTNFALGNCQEIELYKGARGSCTNTNIHIHSLRMPGYIASQEVVFGSSGQIFKIRHDSMDRTCYMDGILLAVRYVYKNKNFVFGLENIM